MKQSDKELYFVAILPPEPVYSKITLLKNEFNERYGSSAALRSPPHITLHMPFRWSLKKESIVIDSLSNIASSTTPFQLQLANFDCFEPRVIYIDVQRTTELDSLKHQVMRNAATIWHIYPLPYSRAFQPHITVAFRDLKKPQFKEAWAEFRQRKFSAIVEISDLTLLKHNGKYWEILHRLPFKKA